MTRFCGVSLRASICTIIILQDTKSPPFYKIVASTKIELGDDRKQDQLITFRDSVKSFVADHDVPSLIVKGRAQKGQFAGGNVSFKMEALIQSIETCRVSIVSPQTMAAFLKKNGSPFELMSTFKYFEEAFDVAFYQAKKA